jgi:rubredoxin
MYKKVNLTPSTHNSQERDTNNGRKDMANKWECTICGYIYDPEKGDATSGIEPNTTFESLPDDWVCPICGVLKDMFKEVVV